MCIYYDKQEIAPWFLNQDHRLLKDYIYYDVRKEDK